MVLVSVRTKAQDTSLMGVRGMSAVCWLVLTVVLALGSVADADTARLTPLASKSASVAVWVSVHVTVLAAAMLVRAGEQSMTLPGLLLKAALDSGTVPVFCSVMPLAHVSRPSAEERLAGKGVNKLGGGTHCRAHRYVQRCTAPQQRSGCLLTTRCNTYLVQSAQTCKWQHPAPASARFCRC